MPTSVLALLLAAATAEAEPRFELNLPAEVTLVGLTFGVRPELLYRPFAPGTASRLRLAVGVLNGPEQFFVPVSLGYRAVYRDGFRVRPLLGAGLEVQNRFVNDAPAVHQLAAYGEAGVQYDFTPFVTAGLAAAIDVAFLGGPGAGLGVRVFAGYRL